jgi:hypothetical protein
MFLHSFWQHDPQAPRKLVIQANWYEQIGINPVNGLPQIEYNENFGSCSLAFLDDCIAENCAFFPSSPWDATCHRFDVVLHHSSSWYVCMCVCVCVCVCMCWNCLRFVCFC